MGGKSKIGLLMEGIQREMDSNCRGLHPGAFVEDKVWFLYQGMCFCSLVLCPCRSGLVLRGS